MAAEKIWELFIINPGTLNVNDLKSFVKIIKFNPEIKRLFPDGFILADPINNNTGGILYPKDTELTAERIERLLQLKEKKPDYEFQISIRKGKKVADYFREQIKKDINKLIEAKKNKQEFRKSIDRIEKTFALYLDDILKDDELIYLLFRGRSIDEINTESGIPRFFFHSINVAIFSLEILQNAFITTGYRFDRNDLINAVKLGLVHDIASIEVSGQYTELPLEKQRDYYLEQTAQSYIIGKSVNLEDPLIEALKKFGDYYQGNKAVINEDDHIESKYANILITADKMDLMVSGIFSPPVYLKTATDMLYVATNNKEVRKGFVDALAKGLKLNDLFDFYFELERLKKMCLLQKYAQPYPMFGFMSPIVILCSGRRNDCAEYAKNAKTVNLIRATSGLEPGAYGRCKLLSRELSKFYESHYNEIKENVQIKGEEDFKELPKEKTNGKDEKKS